MTDDASPEWSPEEADNFRNGIMQLADFSRDQRQKRDKRLQLCLKGATLQLHKFLNDPERVAAYNAHIETVIAEYQKNNLEPGQDEVSLVWDNRFFASLKIDAKKIEQFKEKDFTIAYGENENSASITREHITFGPTYYNACSDDEIKKVCLHEQMHGLLRQQDGHISWSKENGFSEARIAAMKHAMELACDSLADFVQILPYFSEIKQKMALHWMQKSLIDPERIAQLTGLSVNELVKDYFLHGPEHAQSYLDWEKIKEKQGYTDYNLDPQRIIEESDLERILSITAFQWQAIDDKQDVSAINAYLDHNKDGRILTHPGGKRRYDNSEKIAGNLASDRISDYLSSVYDNYVPNYPERITPILWRDLTEENPEARPSDHAIGVEAKTVAKTEKSSILLQSFWTNIQKCVNKVDQYLNNFVPDHITDHDTRWNFKLNAAMMTTIPLMPYAALTQLIVSGDLHHPIRSGLTAIGFSLGSALFFKNRNDILNKENPLPGEQPKLEI